MLSQMTTLCQHLPWRDFKHKKRCNAICPLWVRAVLCVFRLRMAGRKDGGRRGR